MGRREPTLQFPLRKLRLKILRRGIQQDLRVALQEDLVAEEHKRLPPANLPQKGEHKNDLRLIPGTLLHVQEQQTKRTFRAFALGEDLNNLVTLRKLFRRRRRSLDPVHHQQLREVDGPVGLRQGPASDLHEGDGGKCQVGSASAVGDQVAHPRFLGGL